MTQKLRILITGFGPFPGAPFNPTMALVPRLVRLRRPALGEVELSGHIFPVTYQAVDRELPQLLERHRPDALLMFGLAARTPYVRIETRARNAITTLWPDADQARGHNGSIAADADARMFGPHTLRLLRAALASGVEARASRDAGRYLCNYLSWRAIEATRVSVMSQGPVLAAFVHVPLVGRDGTSQPRGTPRVTPEQLVDAGEAMLLELVRSTRRTLREARTAR